MATTFPAPQVPVVDPKTGICASFWYLFFASLPKPASAPTTMTTLTYAVNDGDTYLIANRVLSTITVTLPPAGNYPGRQLQFKNIQAQLVISAASDVVPLAGGAAGTAILAATAGKWVTLVSDGTAWQIMAGN